MEQNDYFIIDQIKVSGPDYIDTVSETASFNEFDLENLLLFIQTLLIILFILKIFSR